MKLTDHFTLEELTFSQTASRNGWDNTPSASVILNLVRIATLLEEVRKVIGKPIQVTSGYRSKALNDAIGSKETSHHRIGCAADIKVAGMTPDAVVKAIIDSDIQYEQLIREFANESGGGWTHISVPATLNMSPKNQTLIIDRNGTRPYKS